MARMNALIPMQVDSPDIVGSLDRGFTAGRKSALADLYRQHGQGIAAGDTNALNALAGYDPMAALGVQSTRQDMAAQDEMMGFRRNAEARAASGERRAQWGFEQQQQAIEAQKQLERAIGIIRRARTPEEFDQLVRTGGFPDLVGQFGNDRAILAEIVPLEEKLRMGIEAQAANQPEWAVQDGQFYDKRNPQAGAQPIPNFVPKETKPLVDMSGANFGPQGSGVTDKFYEDLDKQQAQMFGTILNEGMTIPQNLAKVDQLEDLLSRAPSGAEGALKFAAGQFGINTEGLDELQAAQALISQLVPAQRPPGSGPMSDADLVEFKKSLPSLINQPGGNKIILDTMRGIMIYQLQQADIAAKVASREITPAQGREELRNLQNPLQAVRKAGETTIGGYIIREVTE